MITAQDPAWRAQVTTASLDPFRGYATGLRTSLPEAVRVLDAFHVVRLGQAAVNDVRRRRKQESLGRRGHREDPLYRGQRLLRRGFPAPNQRQRTRPELTLTVGDPSGQLTQAWMVAQELQLLYARSHDLTDAKRRRGGSWTAAPAPTSLSCSAWPAFLMLGPRSCWPTGLRPADGALQRPDRGHERPDQEGKAGRTRLPNLRQLPTSATAHRRPGLAHRALAGCASHPIRGRSPRLVA